MQKSNKNISEMFNAIAHRYDLLNHLLSANLDKLWRKTAIKQIVPAANIKILDIATGTGDLAFEAVRINPSKIIGVDIAENMLEIARKKAEQRNLSSLISFQLAASENLPFDSEQFDYITVAFGVRNFEDLEKGLGEMLRVLKPGGKAIILEFSKPDNSFILTLYYFYFKRILPLVGKLVSKSSFAYTYLPNSVEEFPYGRSFLSIMENVGFTKTDYIKQTFGIASIYYGYKEK